MTDLGASPSAFLGGLGQTVADVGHAMPGSGADAGPLAGALGQVVTDVGHGVGAAAGAPTEHVVQAGETLGGIASDHGVTVHAMMSANPQVLHPDIVETGARLTVPSASSQTATSHEEGNSLSAGPPASGEAQPPSGRAPVSSGADASSEPPSLFGSATVTGRATLSGAPPAPGAALASGGAARGPGAGDILEGGPSSSGIMLAALARGGVDWRLQQQQGAAPLSGVAGAMFEGPEAAGPQGLRVLLQALAGDPLATAALARLLGDSKSAVLAVLAARLAMAPALETASGAARSSADAAPGGGPSQSPPGVDLAARVASRSEAPRIRTAAARAVPETPQEGWIRRCAPAAIEVKGRWGVPAGFIIAHGALTSDWGRLAPGNDYFGILPNQMPGAARAMVALSGSAATAFDSLDHAADAFGGRLRADGRYAAAFRAPHTVSFSARIAAEGLVSDPLYAPAMEAVIEAHALARFD